MMYQKCGVRIVALAVAVSLLGLPTLVAAEVADATLTGVIRAADGTPLPGARLVAMDPESGQVITSEPTGADGTFTLPGLPAGSYELGVASGEMLFLVESPLYVVAGVIRHVQIQVDPEQASSEVIDGSTALPQSMKNNPVLAVFLLITGATLIAELLDEITEDDEPVQTPVITN